MEQEISGISKFPEKKQPGQVDRNFPNKFWKLSIPFDFEPACLGILVEWNTPNMCLIFSKNMQQCVLYKATLAMLPIWTVDSPPKPKSIEYIQKLDSFTMEHYLLRNKAINFNSVAD